MQELLIAAVLFLAFVSGLALMGGLLSLRK